MLNYFEKRNLYDVARAMTDEEALLFLEVFLLEKGLYPVFTDKLTAEELEVMKYPTGHVNLVSSVDANAIGSLISASVKCEACPFKTIYNCNGSDKDKLECCGRWTRWFKSTIVKM